MLSLVALAFALAQDKPPEPPKAPLEFTLVPAAAEAALGDDIQVEATLKNVSDKPLTVAPLLFDERAVSFNVKAETSPGSTKSFEYSLILGSLYVVAPPPLEKLALAPGKSFVSGFKIPATMTGQWTITGRFAGGEAPVESKPVAIKVNPKDGKSKLSVRLTFTHDAGKETSIFIDLNAVDAPASVMHFVSLVNRGFYKNLKLVEVVRNNWMRAGCPNNDGFGDAGYTYRSENKDQEQSPNKASLRFDVGTVALNQHQKMGYQSSQFFIALRQVNFLDYKFTIIGKVDLDEGGKGKGADAIKDLASKADPDRETNRPKTDVTVKDGSVVVR
jgi:cyclophilin family peptidyl-prolyl cis-trans isomerase